MSPSPHILVLGVGSIGERHLRCFGSTERCRLSFCEPMEQRREEVAARYGVTGFPSWEEALEADDFDAAVIASPAPWHIPLAQALTERGLDLLIEKPLSLDLEGIDRLVATIAERGTHVAVGFNLRALPSLRHMRDAIRSGEFGRVVQVQVVAGQHFPFYRPAYREIYYADPKQGGGLIQDMLPHSLNAVEWIAGPATRVVVDASHEVLPGVEVEDTVNLLTRHGDVRASFTVNQHQPVNETVITAHCENGSARWILLEGSWLSATEPGGEWIERESHQHERDDYYILQANAFLDFLEGESPPLCPLEDGIATLRSVLAILESREAGLWVDVASTTP